MAGVVMMGRALAVLLLFVLTLTAARQVSDQLCEPVASVTSSTC